MRLTTFRQLIALSLITATTRSGMAFSLAVDAAKGGEMGSMTARDPSEIFKRDDGCSSVGLNSDYESCGMGLPNNFCCNKKAGYTCNAFNNNQSAICCPPGQDCSTFNQIQCNPQGLNVTAPDAGNANIHSTKIVGGLVICSDLCCPMGYTCSTDDSKTCILSSKSSLSASPTSTGPAASISNVAGGISPNQAASSGGATDNNHCPAFPVPSVLVGFFPGLVLGIILTVAAILCIGGRSRNKQSKDAGPSPMSSPNPSKSSVRALVSDPIFHETGATRSDFLRRMSRARNRSSPKSPGTMSTVTANPSVMGLSRHGSARVRGLFSGSTRRAPPVPGTGAHNDNDGNHDGARDVPKTPPPRTPRRQSSTESIVIFSPEHVGSSNPPGSATTRDTRWEDVMGGSGVSGLGVRGLAAPPAFLGSPSIVDPRKKGLDGTAFIRR